MHKAVLSSKPRNEVRAVRHEVGQSSSGVCRDTLVSCSALGHVRLAPWLSGRSGSSVVDSPANKR